MKKFLLISGILLTTLLAACSVVDLEENSAAQDCEANGGTVDIRVENGEQVGYCIFPHGVECSEEDYNNGTCDYQQDDTDENTQLANPASTNCVEQGGTLEIRKDDEGNETGYCLLPNGTVCEEWALFNGECSAESVDDTMQTPPEDAVFGNVYINSSALTMVEGSTDQIAVQIEGDLPTPCHKLYVDIKQPYQSNEIHISAESWHVNDPQLACAQVITPFDKTIMIPTDTIENGTYTVFVNGDEVGAFQYSN